MADGGCLLLTVAHHGWSLPTVVFRIFVFFRIIEINCGIYRVLQQTLVYRLAVR